MPAPKVTSLTPLSSDSAKWIQLQKATYTDSKGTPRVWELASRTTTSASGVDAVAIGPIIRHPSKPAYTILVLQFRPPVNAMTVEWPAGLIDAGETPEEAAARELREETGFTGKVTGVSPAVCADPGMSSANLKLVMMDVQVQEGEEMPAQALDEGEEITRVEVPLAELYDRLVAFDQEGYVVAAKLWHWAAGVRFALENPGLFGRNVSEVL